MLGWSIVAIVFLVVFIVTIITHLYSGEWYLETVSSFINMISGVFLFVCVLVLLVLALSVKEEINEYSKMQELVEATYSETEPGLNYAMNVKILEMNEWLAGARSSEEIYGIFSFYNGKLDDLEYIEIGD